MPHRDLTDDRNAMRRLTGKPPLPPPLSLYQLLGQGLVDVWLGLRAFACFVLPFLARPKPAPPQLPARTPRERRPVRSLEQADWPRAVLETALETCPICGMHDPDLAPEQRRPTRAVAGRQWTLEDVNAATPIQVQEAMQAGLLRHLGFGAPRRR